MNEPLKNGDKAIVIGGLGRHKSPNLGLTVTVGMRIFGAHSADQLRKLAEVKYPNGKPGEGIVLRSLSHEWSFKVLNLLYKN